MVWAIAVKAMSWTTEWIYGMGTFNMKSALATYTVAFESIRAAGIEIAGNVVIAGRCR